MVPRHLPKKLLCVALIGTSILAVLYYTNGISNSSEHKYKPENENDLEKKSQNNHQSQESKGIVSKYVDICLRLLGYDPNRISIPNLFCQIGLSTSKMNPRIVPQPLSHLATSEKSSAESHIHPNDDVVNVHKELDQKVCSTDPMMERVSDLDTTNIYPHLDFNVS